MLHPDGMPGWIDLLTPDPAEVQPFYTGVFNWRYTQRPAPDGGTSVVCVKGDKTVAGMHRLPEHIQAAGMPSVWSASLIVADLESTIAAAESAGGTVVIPATESGGEGRLASVADPTGGAIGLWQPGTHQGADLLRAPGAFTWLELHTRDVPAALPFYEQVFGWRWERMGAGGGPVAFLDSVKGLNKAVASARPMPEQAPPDAPSYWLPFLGSDDPADSARRARAAGGDVFVEPEHIKSVGTYAGLADPAGAHFMVIRFDLPSAGTILKAVGSRLFGGRK